MNLLPEGYQLVYPYDEDSDFLEALDHSEALAKEAGLYISLGKDLACGVCTDNGELVACVWTEADEASYHFDIAVKPEFQGRGLGRYLLDTHLNVPYDIEEVYPECKPVVEVINLPLAHAIARRGFAVMEAEPGKWIMTPKENVSDPWPLPPLSVHQNALDASLTQPTPKEYAPLDLEPAVAPEQPINAMALRQQFFHAVTPYKLERVANLGLEALIAPSLAITERPDLLSIHGNIILIAHHHAFHNIEHQVFSDDAYTPRVPQVTASINQAALESLVSRFQQAYAHFDLPFYYAKGVLRPQKLPLSLSLRDQVNTGQLTQELWVLYAYENDLPLQRVNESGIVDIEFITDELKSAILNRLDQEKTVDFPLTQDPELVTLFRQGIDDYLAREHANSPRKQALFRGLAEKTYFSSPDALSFSALCSLHDEMRQSSSHQIDWYQTRQRNADSYRQFEHDSGWYHQFLKEVDPSWSIEEGELRVPLNDDNIKRFIAKGVVNTESGALFSYNMIRANAVNELTKEAWLTQPLTTDIALFEQQEEVISEGYFALSDALDKAYPFKMTLPWLTQEIIAFHQRLQRQGEQAIWRIQDHVISEHLTAQARVLIEKVLHLPSKYFEVKTHGLAPLSKFHTALVKDPLPAHLTELLTRNGVSIKQCDTLDLEQINKTVNDYQATQAHKIYIEEYLNSALQAQPGIEPGQLPALLKEHSFPSVFTEKEFNDALGIVSQMESVKREEVLSLSAAIAPKEEPNAANIQRQSNETRKVRKPTRV